MRFSIAPALALIAAAASPAAAQYIGAAPPPPTAPAAGTVETPAAALARNVRLLAANPKNFDALMAAGRAELDLGDLEAAIGFFGRADEVRPSDPGPKIGMGAATTLNGDARGALAWFGQAQSLGASAAVMGADRGLAHDLLGQLTAAQADYRAALNGANRDEARRRLALSLAIGGQTTEALTVLQPLLNRRDPAAQRVRAFVLALGGDQAQASRAIDLAMPGSAARVGPFFALLPRLSTEQKAAAVHLGVFPTAGEVKLAAAAPPPAPSHRTPAVAVPKTVTHKSRRGTITTSYRPLQQPSEPQLQAATPATELPSGAAVVELAEAPPASHPKVEASPPAREVASPAPGFSSSVLPAGGDRLSGIDRILAATAGDGVQLPGRPAVRSTAKAADTKAATDKKAAAAKKAADKKAADKKAADQKAAEEKMAAAEKKAAEARIGVAGAHWVQLAGGSNEERMATEYKRIKAKKPALFTGHAGYVTGGRDYFRLLVGPFDDADEARAFVNKLAKAGIDGFSWTRTPAQIKIEKLPTK